MNTGTQIIIIALIFAVWFWAAKAKADNSEWRYQAIVGAYHVGITEKKGGEKLHSFTPGIGAIHNSGFGLGVFRNSFGQMTPVISWETKLSQKTAFRLSLARYDSRIGVLPGLLYSPVKRVSIYMLPNWGWYRKKRTELHTSCTVGEFMQCEQEIVEYYHGERKLRVGAVFGFLYNF